MILYKSFINNFFSKNIKYFINNYISIIYKMFILNKLTIFIILKEKKIIYTYGEK